MPLDSTPSYIQPGVNFAPKLTDLSDRVTSPNKLTLALQTKYHEYMNRDDQVWREHCDIGQMVSNKRTGKLLLLRNPMSGAMTFVRRDGRFEDRKTMGGMVQFYSSKLTAGWMSSRPEIDPLCPSDDDQVEQYISDVKIVQDFYNLKFFDDDYEYLESISAQDFGTWITRFRFDPEIQDITMELLDFPACRWDIRKRAEDSGYFIYQSKCSNAVLEHLLDADIASDGDDEESYGLQKVDQMAKQGGNVDGYGKNQPYGWMDSNDNENVVIEMWLQPEELCDIEIEEETTMSGKKIPAGNAAKLFPNGMVAIGINGMQTIPWIYAENHKEHIVTGLYHTQSFCGVGKGISDIIDPSKEMDDLFSQALSFVKSHSMPCWGFNADVVSEDKVKQIGHGRKAIALDFSNAPDGANTVNHVIQGLTPGDPGNAVELMMDKLNDQLQISSQVTNFSNAFPGVDNKTATGAKFGAENAQMLLVPQLRNKASHRKRAFKVIFNLFKKYVDKPKFFAFKDLNGISAGKDLSGTQFDGVDIDFEIVADSERPNTPLLQQEGMTNLFQFTGGLPGLLQAQQMDPDTTARVAQVFGIKLPINTTEEVARVCRRRIQLAKQFLNVEMANQQVMTMTAQATGNPALLPDNTNLPTAIVSQVNEVIPISPFEKFAAQKADWMQNLLDTDEFQYPTKDVPHVVEMRYVLQELIRWQLGISILGQSQMQQAQSLGTVMSEMPMYLGQQALSQENQALQSQYEQQQAVQAAQQQSLQQQQQAAQQLQMKHAEASINQRQAEADHQRALAVSDDTHAKTKELKEMDIAAQAEQAKQSAKKAAA